MDHPVEEPKRSWLTRRIWSIDRWVKRQHVSFMLALRKRALSKVGSDDARDLMRSIPIEAARSIYGIGPFCVDSLRRAGFTTAASLWDHQRSAVMEPRSFRVGPVRGRSVHDWGVRVCGKCLRQAEKNRQRRIQLLGEIQGLEATLSALNRPVP
jgi:hypothetical protein